MRYPALHNRQSPVAGGLNDPASGQAAPLVRLTHPRPRHDMKTTAAATPPPGINQVRRWTHDR